MKYLLRKLGDPELSIVHMADRQVVVPPFKIACNPMIPLKEFGPLNTPRRIQRVQEDIAKAYEEMLKLPYEHAQELALASPDAKYIVVLVRTEFNCLAADAPPRPIYDPPAEWDDEEQDFVVPEGAKVVGHTESAFGWMFQTCIGLVALQELPEGRFEEETSDRFPAWMVEPTVPTDMMAYLMTPRGKAKLAARFGVGLGYGPPPLGAKTPEDLTQE